MIEVISPDEFKQIPWKNGKGLTTELAINEGGKLDDFKWRISIALVDENGPFSNFKGYYRHLVLIRGNGIHLNHGFVSSDILENVLDMARFNGSSRTVGKLLKGPINDLNIMTKINKYEAEIKVFSKNTLIVLENHPLVFIYCNDEDTSVSIQDGIKNIRLLPNHLLKVTDNVNKLKVIGKNIIIIYIREKI